MKQSKKSILRTVAKLREIIDSDADAEVTRMAYFAETTLLWAISDTVDWARPEADLLFQVSLLRQKK